MPAITDKVNNAMTTQTVKRTQLRVDREWSVSWDSIWLSICSQRTATGKI